MGYKGELLHRLLKQLLKRLSTICYNDTKARGGGVRYLAGVRQAR